MNKLDILILAKMMLGITLKARLLFPELSCEVVFPRGPLNVMNLILLPSKTFRFIMFFQSQLK